MRLTDADALMPLFIKKANEMKDRHGVKLGEEWLLNYDDIKDVIDNAPTVITNSVYEAYCALSDEEFEHSNSFWITTPKGKKINFVKERPQGEWIIDGHHYKCSRCGKTLAIMFSEADDDLIGCPFCLADMRGGRE